MERCRICVLKLLSLLCFVLPIALIITPIDPSHVVKSQVAGGYSHCSFWGSFGHLKILFQERLQCFFGGFNHIFPHPTSTKINFHTPKRHKKHPKIGGFGGSSIQSEVYSSFVGCFFQGTCKLQFLDDP